MKIHHQLKCNRKKYIAHDITLKMAITKFCLLGERVSGTCMLNSLIGRNIPGLKPVVFNHKHFFQNMDDIRRADTSGTLFIYVTREPIAWLNSMHKTPYHVHSSLKNKDFSTFIRTEWVCVEDEASGVSQDSRRYGKEMLHERDPETGDRFHNVLAMRSSKTKHTLALSDVVENFVHVRLEDLQAHPKRFVDGICKNYGLRQSDHFEQVTTVRGKGKVKYVPSVYPELEECDTDYVVRQLDLGVESVLGYC